MTERCLVADDVVKDLMSQLAVIGVNGFFFAISTDINRRQEMSFRKLTRRLPQELAEAKYAVFSDKKTHRYREVYMQLFARRDGSFFEKQVLGPNLWGQPDSKQPQLIKLLEANGINSRLSWFLPSRNHRDWLNAFIINSSLSDCELKLALQDNRQQLERILTVYGEYFCRYFIHQLNPIFNFHCLTQTGIKVLEMASEGAASQHIAEALHLSERGVNYHIDRMKVLFGAKNRAQLISRGFQLGILNSQAPSFE